MGLIDKLANAGRGSRVPEGGLDYLRRQGDTTAHRNRLAHKANGFDVSRADRQRAERELVKEVGEKEAKKLIKMAADKVCK